MARRVRRAICMFAVFLAERQLAFAARCAAFFLLVAESIAGFGSLICFRGYRIAWFGTLIASGATAQTAFWVVWAVVLPVSLILADFGRLVFPFVPPRRRKMSAGR